MGRKTGYASLVFYMALAVWVGWWASPRTATAQESMVDYPTHPIDFKLKDLDGKVTSFSSIPGKVWIVDFWATWCPPCREEIPHYVDLQKKYGPKGLKVVGISVDEEGAAAVKPFAKENKINYTMLLADEGILKTLDVTGYPTAFVIGPDRKIRAKYTSYVPRAVLEKEIQKILGEKHS